MKALASALALVAASFAASASAAPLPGNTTTADRAAWDRLLHWPASCESAWKATGTPGSGVQLIDTGTTGTLVFVQCAPGAYQGEGSISIVRSATDKVGPVELAIYVDPGNGRPKLVGRKQILGVVTYARKTGYVTVLDKFAGAGGCGILSTYRIQGDHLPLVRAQAKLACDGKPPFDPSRWPLLPIPASS